MAINTGVLSDISNVDLLHMHGLLTKEEALTQMLLITQNWIIIHRLTVTDLLPGKLIKNTTEIERARALKSYLVVLDEEMCKYRPVDAVLIEKQPTKVSMSTNTISSYVSAQIMIWYADANVQMVDPKQKNTISIDIVGSYAKIRETARDNYSARKKHSKLTMLNLLETFGLTKMLEGVSKSCYDDAADALLQAIVWAKNNL
jgi:Poxvirus A22 protein